MGVPSAAGLRLDMRESRARRRAGDANEVVAAGALDLPAGVAGIALQRLFAVGTIEFEFGSVHRLHPPHAQDRGQKYVDILFQTRGFQTASSSVVKRTLKQTEACAPVPGLMPLLQMAGFFLRLPPDRRKFSPLKISPYFSPALGASRIR